MSLLDTIDGAFMNFAYGWAFSQPVRKLYYNITVTGLSVAVALLIGDLELLSVLADRLSLTGGVWDCRLEHRPEPRRLSSSSALFVATWAGALAIWRFGHIEERWSAGLQSRPDRAGAS